MANPYVPPKRSWLDSWAGGRLDTFRPSVDSASQVPTFDPRLVSNDPKEREQAQREQRQARARMARDVARQAESAIAPSAETASTVADLAGRVLNPAYDIARTAPEARAEWGQGGFWPRARAARNMLAAALPLIPGGASKGKKLWDMMSAPGSTGFTVTRDLKPIRGAGFGVADPAYTHVLRTGEGAKPPLEQIEEFLARPAVRARIRDKSARWGGWWDQSTGRGEINITDYLKDQDEATRLGMRRHQKALGSYDETGAYAGDVPLPAPKGNDLIISVAERYKQERGLTDSLREIDEVDPVAGRQMARQYERLKSAPDDPEVRAAYEQFAREVDDQFRAIEEAGVKIEFVDADPYPNSAAMMADLRDNNRLKVLRTNASSRHPILTNEQNDRFRAVHDFFGHASEGNQFGVGGEERAFRRHVSMFSPAARRVMATETRGQNSWYNFGPNADRPKGQRVFAEQKAALWPEEMLGEYDAVRSYDPDAVRYDRFRRPEGDVGDYTIPKTPETRSVVRVENPEGEGPYTSGAADMIFGDMLDDPSKATRRWPTFGLRQYDVPRDWINEGLFAFRDRKALDRWFNPEEQERLLAADFSPTGYDVRVREPGESSRSFNLRQGRGGQVIFNPDRANRSVLGGTDAELQAAERARALEGEAELARYERMMPLVPAADDKAAAITRQQANAFEESRLEPAIRVPTGGVFTGPSHFAATEAFIDYLKTDPSVPLDLRRAASRSGITLADGSTLFEVPVRTEQGFASALKGFQTREQAMAGLRSGKARARAIVTEQGFPPDQLTSEALGEVQIPPVPVRPLPREDVRATISRMESILGQPGEPFVPRSRGIFDRSIEDPVMEGSTLAPAAGRTNPIIEEIASDPETYRLARMATERGLPMGGAGFYNLGPVRASYGGMRGPLTFDDFLWAGSASSARNPIPLELSNASILLYAMRHGITPKQAIAEMLRRYPGAKNPSFLPVHATLFDRYRRSGVIDPPDLTSGARKVPSYGRAKSGEAGANTIDTHDKNFLGMPSRWRPYLEGHDLTGADYDALNLNERIAADLGIQTRQAQAGRWIGGSEVTGVRTPPGDYLQILEDAIHRTASESGRGTRPRELQSLWRKIAQGEDFILPFYGGWTRPR